MICDLKHLKYALTVGDEYLVKPLIMEELKIRIDYRYKKEFRQHKTTIKYKNFFYNVVLKQLFKNNERIKTTPNEQDSVRRLMCLMVGLELLACN